MTTIRATKALITSKSNAFVFPVIPNVNDDGNRNRNRNRNSSKFSLLVKSRDLMRSIVSTNLAAVPENIRISCFAVS
jgi:hypothetical protein